MLFKAYKYSEADEVSNNFNKSEYLYQLEPFGPWIDLFPTQSPKSTAKDIANI